MAEIQTNIRKFKINSKLVKRIIALVVVIAVGVTAVTIYQKNSKSKQATIAQQTSKVTRGNLSISITGTGTVSSTTTASVASKVAETVKKVYFSEGDEVKKGDLLYELDNSSILLEIEKIKNNIATAQLSSQDNIDTIGKLNITAPASGIITSIPVKVGDTVQKNGQVATVIDQSQLKLTVPIKVASLDGISQGGSVLVHIQSTMQSVQGVISMVTSPVTTSDGMYMVNLEVDVPNTGTLKEGLKATVEVFTGSESVFSTDTGTLSYINTSAIKSETGGTVSSLRFNEGDAVSAGSVIMTLSSSDLQLTKQTNDIKMSDLMTQLETSQKKLEDYKIYSTIDGTITSQNLHEGDAVKLADVTTKISNVKSLQCSIPIDELDISKVKVGQKTTITADALSATVKKPLVGEVTSIGLSGTTTNGVTTYPVIISIPYTEGMRIGMNISAEIFVQEKQNALSIPLESIHKVGNKNYVIVKGGTGNGNDELTKLMQQSRQQGAAGNNNTNKNSSNKTTNSSNKTTSSSSSKTASSSTNKSSTSSTSSSKNTKSTVDLTQYFKNTTLKEVELGINNESSIEVISGVSEGDEVVLTPRTTTSQSGSQNMGAAGGLGMMGGAGGGAPQGGPVGGPGK